MHKELSHALSSIVPGAYKDTMEEWLIRKKKETSSLWKVKGRARYSKGIQSE